MKKILLVSTSFPGNVLHSGREAAGSFVYDFVQELSQYVEVTVIAPGNDDHIENAGGFRVRFFSVSQLPLSLLHASNPLKWPAILHTLNSGRKAVLEEVTKNSPDHVFALWALPSGYWVKQACKSTGIPYSIWALGSDIWHLGGIPVVRQILRSVLRGSNRCFADGIQLASDVSAISGEPCEFLPSCRELPVIEDSVKPTSRPPYKLAFLGRWHKNKGIDILLESLILLTDSDWEHIKEVRIYGGGQLKNLVLAGVKNLQDRGRPVTAGGYLNTVEAAELYHWSDYILIPSRKDSIPVVFSDAIQSHRPVIAMPVGDLPKLIQEGKTGVLAEAISSSAYSHAIQDILTTDYSRYFSETIGEPSIFSVSRSVDLFLKTIKS